ncbi:ABC transporter ATP-binding protein [Salinarimonas rosea]|uniref:ABC transporter ATP-binding protein n=1 Tax=Salinarimonas rosea TaxID=552063 RepID=UPI00041DFD15|nr:ABC transporter ATP-binding protein [Salinarimonas rosea]
MASVTLTSVTKAYGTFKAVDDVTLTVEDGEFLVLLGPSGCGKTTTLRIVAGFVEATGGRVSIAGRDVTREPPYRRNLGLVFQNYALFPHLSVFENVAFGLRRRRIAASEIGPRVERALGLVKLSDLAGRLPKQLSGGQQQRVAIARAIAIEPDVLLLDEPLSNLDAKLRVDVRRELKRLQAELGITTIMVTHDQDEAMSMGDRLVVMNQGRVQQIGEPKELYRSPANRFVGSFIGQANALQGRMVDGFFHTDCGLRFACERAVPGADLLMIRPEAIDIALEPPEQDASHHAGVVDGLVYLGPHYELSVQLPGGQALSVQLPQSSAAVSALRRGAPVYLSVDPRNAIGIRDGDAVLPA